jgi:hypothetical protein
MTTAEQAARLSDSAKERTAARLAARPEWARRLEDLISGLTDERSPELATDTLLLVDALARAAIIDPRNLSRELLHYGIQTEYDNRSAS